MHIWERTLSYTTQSLLHHGSQQRLAATGRGLSRKKCVGASGERGVTGDLVDNLQGVITKIEAMCAPGRERLI